MNPNALNIITLETFDTLYSIWADSKSPLKWDCLFVTPPWMKAWWDAFGIGQDLKIYGVRSAEDIIGIAPLLLKGKTACFLGDGDVCDYLDFIVAPSREAEFFNNLIPFLRKQGIHHLDLGPIHKDSSILTVFVNIAKALQCDLQLHQEDVLFELDLKKTWDGYLNTLSRKYRHEIRRKFRKIEKAGSIRYYIVEDIQSIDQAMDTFFALFRLNRSDKSGFMNDQMASFFRLLASSFARFDMLELSFLEVNQTPVATVMCFDYQSTIYLYNNGYDNRFAWLSVGLISKLFSIRDSLEKGKKTYNFLKGEESYKRRLGGKEVPVYRCRVRL